MGPPEDTRPLILVTGATGYIGGRLVPRLLQRGYRVRCLARDPTRLQGRGWDPVEVCTGDVLQPETLAPAMVGVAAAYYLVHSMSSGERGFEERDRQGASHFAQAARVAGVARLIYLGGLGEDRPNTSAHLRSRHETGEILRREGPPVTEFRAAMIVGSGSISFEMLRCLTERLPVMICPYWVTTLSQPIGIRDVLAYLLDCLQEPRSTGRVLEIGGADQLTYADMMRGYAHIRGLRRWILQVPVLTPRLSSYWVDLVTPIPSALARPLIEGLRSEVIVRDPSARELFPHIHPLSYQEAVRIALDRMEHNAIETVWSMALSSSLPDGVQPVRFRQTEGMLLESHQGLIPAPAARVYQTFLGIGGRQGWLAFPWLWGLRAWLDRLVGGVGFRRGRRNSQQLFQGEVVDWWRAEEVLPDQRLRLRAEMKVPGRAWLQFDVTPRGETHSELTVTAFYEPKGLLGLLYWYALVPIHRPLFRRLIRRIGDLAVGQRAGRAAGSAVPRTVLRY